SGGGTYGRGGVPDDTSPTRRSAPEPFAVVPACARGRNRAGATPSGAGRGDARRPTPAWSGARRRPPPHRTARPGRGRPARGGVVPKPPGRRGLGPARRRRP